MGRLRMFCHPRSALSAVLSTQVRLARILLMPLSGCTSKTPGCFSCRWSDSRPRPIPWLVAEEVRLVAPHTCRLALGSLLCLRPGRDANDYKSAKLRQYLD